MKWMRRVIEGGGFGPLLGPDEQYCEVQLVDAMIDLYVARSRGDVADANTLTKCEKYCRIACSISDLECVYKRFCKGCMLREIPECIERHPELQLIDWIIYAYMLLKSPDRAYHMGGIKKCEEYCRRLCGGASLNAVYMDALNSDLSEAGASRPTTDVQRCLAFDSITDSMLNTYKHKNHDYGDSFAKLRAKMPNAILVRLFDKYSRLEALLQNPDSAQVKDESIDDTLLDLATYAVMELVERRLDKKTAE